MLQAAVELADEGGIGSVTMRRLADKLGAEAMSLYYHLANKDDLLDGIADAVAREINQAVDQVDMPSGGASWQTAMRRRIRAARARPAGTGTARPGFLRCKSYGVR